MSLDFEAALIHPLLALGTQFDLWRGPVRQDIVGLVEQIVQAVEVALDRHLHLIALGNLLTRQFMLLIGLL